MKPTIRLMPVALAAALAWLPTRAALAQDDVAIKAGKLLPVSGAPIENGVVLVRDGKITAVGKDLAIPANARVIDATGKVVIPGYIEAHSSTGVDVANERNPEVPFASVLDSIDPGHEYFEDSRRNGITTVAIVPGHNTMIGGQAAVVKTAGKFVDDMILKRSAGIKISLRPSQGRSRMSHLAALRRSLTSTQDFIRDADEKKKADPKAEPTEPDIKREPMVRLLSGEIPAFIYCDRAMDVARAIELTTEFKLKTILVLGRDCHKAAAEVAKSGLPVVLEPQLVFWEHDDRTNDDRQIALPKVYRDAGVKVVFQAVGISGGNLFFPPNLPTLLGQNFLWYQAATAVKYGTPADEALEAITLRPAKLLGIDQFVGSIDVGKDADLVVLSGDPLKLDTWVETVLVAGKVVYERSKDTKLQQLLTPDKSKDQAGGDEMPKHDEDDEQAPGREGKMTNDQTPNDQGSQNDE